MTEKEKEKIALFRYGILSPLITGSYEGKDYEFFREAASKIYESISGKEISFHHHTIYRWYKAYLKDGFDGLKPKGRADENRYRKLSDDAVEEIKFNLNEYPRIPATLIYQKLLDNNTITSKTTSLSTVTRFVSSYKRDLKLNTNKDMRRYEKEHINELWCGDSSVGPYIKVDGQKYKTYIIALIDDASRFIVGIDIFFNDNFINLMSVIKSAITKYGKPKMFNFDNGSNYRCNQMTLLAARIGVAINYNPIHTPTSKAKIERWFRTLKDHWMANINYNDFKSLEELRKSLLEYVQKYNSEIHSSLNGKSPIDRFFKESNMIIRMSQERIDKAFLLEIERKVSNDNVIIIEDEEYEVNYKYAGKKLLLRYSPDLSKIYVVNNDESLEEIHLLDKHSNSNVKREKIMITKGE